MVLGCAAIWDSCSFTGGQGRGEGGAWCQGSEPRPGSMGAGDTVREKNWHVPCPQGAGTKVRVPCPRRVGNAAVPRGLGEGPALENGHSPTGLLTRAGAAAFTAIPSAAVGLVTWSGREGPRGAEPPI